MKTAIYTEDGLVQLVMTPESEFEKTSLSIFRGKPLDAKLFEGSFYDCRGGWVRQTALQKNGLYRGADREDESLILVAREAEPPPKAEDVSGITSLMRGTNDVSIKELNAASELNMARLHGEDTTGLCTVRDFAESIIESGIEAVFTDSGFAPLANRAVLKKVTPWGEMTFVHNCKRYSVEMIVNRCEDVQS